VTEVQQQDQEVRGETPGSGRETTMVRSFSRHFFEALAGEGEEKAGADVVELDASELLEEEEEIGDEDIVEEADSSTELGPRRRGRGVRRGPTTGA